MRANREPPAERPEHLILSGPEHLRITGANGSGKTTLIEAIAHASEADYLSPWSPPTALTIASRGRIFLSALASTRS